MIISVRHLAAVLTVLFISSMPANAIVLGGLIQDLNPDIGVSTSGSNVTSWANQGSGGDNVSTNLGTPQLLSGALNGHNVIAFTDDRMASASDTAFDSIMQGSGHTWFAVVRVNPGDNAGGKNSVIGTLREGGPFSGFVAHVGDGGGLDTTGRYLTRPGSGDVFAVGTTEIAGQQFNILAGRLSAGTGSQTAELFINSAVVNASASPSISAATDSGPLAIGAERAGGGERFDGYLARVLIYDRPLSDAEITQNGVALSQAYGLTNGFATSNTETMIWNFDQGTLADTTGTNSFAVASGTAFSNNPLTYAGTDSNNPFGGGTGFVRSDFFNDGVNQTKPGDGPQGSLESEVFVLGNNAGFMFEAAGDGGLFQLVEAGSNTVLASVDPNRRSTTMDAYAIDASAFAGMSVFLRILDNSSGGWGHIAVDSIVYTASAAINVPEPATLAMLSLGGLACLGRRRRSA